MATNINLGTSINNPWKGLNFYQEGEILYGRDDEIQSLALYVINNTQTVLYGKSGIGKSSIINAGVFPIARKEGLFPIPVRLKHDTNTTYTSQIKAAFFESDIGISKILEPLDESKETIWEFLHRNTFYNKETNKSVRPLIVFDQFEELFTLQHDEKRKLSFFSELADLLNEITPNYIANSLAVIDSKTTNPKSGIDGFSFDFGVANDFDDDKKKKYVSDSLFNIVFTIREDFLSYLERYTKYIPVMKSNRYALLPINEEQAKDIIMKPVEGLVDIDVAKLIIEKVTGRTDFKLGDVPEIYVDAAVLSLFLSRIYIKKGKEATITAALVNKSSKDIIQDFYKESVGDLPTGEIERLEDLLLTYDNRRNNVSRNDLIREGISDNVITTLVEERKLLRQFSYQDDIRVEFMHDILCSIVNERIEHREQLKKEREAKKKEAEEEARREKERLLQEEKLKKVEEEKLLLIRKQQIQEEENKLLQRKQEEERRKLENEKLLVSQKKSRNRKIALLLSALTALLVVVAIVIISMYVKNEKQRKELDAVNSEIRTILPSVIEQQIKDGDSYNAGKLLLKLFPDTLYVAEDPVRISLLRELSGSKSTILKGHSRPVNSAVFNKDESLVITGSDDMTIRIWDSMTGALISTANLGSPVMSLAISPDDKIIVVSTKDGYLRTFSITHGNAVLQDSLAQESYARFVTFNPKGSEVFACYTNGNLLVCNSSNLSQVKAYKISKKGATCVSFDKNGQRMALGGTDNTIMIWDATQLTSLYTLPGHMDWVRSVDFSSDGENLVSCSDDKTVRLWNLRSRKCTIVQELPDWVTKASFSPNGKRIISSCRDGVLRTIDVATLCEIPSSQINHSGSLNHFDLSQDGRRVITCSTDTDVHIWDYGTPMDFGVSMRLSGAVYGLSVLSGTNKIAAVTNNGTLGVWNAETGSDIWKKEREVGRVTALSVSPNGKIIAISAGSKIRIFKSDNGEELVFDNTGGHHGWIRNLCFNHSGNTLASVGEDKSIILWDMDKRKFMKQIFGHASSVYAVDFSKDDRKMVTGSNDMTIRQWDVASGKQIGASITGHKSVVLCVRYNSNDSLILSSSGDQTACLWKTDGTLVNHFVGASGYMTDAIFGLTEDEIITASADKYIRIWCLRTGKETARLGGHFGGVSRLALFEDGILVSSDNIGRINVWKVPDLKSTAEELLNKYNIVDEKN